MNTFIAALQGDCGGNLDRLEYAIIQIALYPRQGVNQALVAHAEAYAPAGHGIAFGKRVKFDANILCARGLQKARRLVVVKNQVGVRKIVNYPEIVLLCKIHNLLEKIQIDNFRCRIMRI